MVTEATAAREATMPAPPAQQLSEERLLQMYYKMLLARKLDERMWALHRQGRCAFHISGMGHEAAQVGAAFALRPGYDWVHPYYRDLALVLALGMTPRQLMLALFAKAEDPSSGGRQMPSHFGYAPLKIVSCRHPGSTGRRHRPGLPISRRGCRDIDLFRRGKHQPGRFSRRAELGQHPQTACDFPL